MAGRLTSRPAAPTQAPAPPGVHALTRIGQPETVLLVPPGATAEAPLLVFFHGAGGSGGSGVRHVRDAATDAGALVLAPTSTASTWDLLSGGVGPDVAALDAALAQVFSRHAVTTVALAGFSDGGSYALSLALANGDLASEVVAFSPGFVAPPDQVGVPRVWVSHGTTDTVLPVQRCGRQVVARLREAGYDVTYEEFDGGHVVPPHLARAALAWWLTPPTAR